MRSIFDLLIWCCGFLFFMYRWTRFLSKIYWRNEEKMVKKSRISTEYIYQKIKVNIYEMIVMREWHSTASISTLYCTYTNTENIPISNYFIVIYFHPKKKKISHFKKWLFRLDDVLQAITNELLNLITI